MLAASWQRSRDTERTGQVGAHGVCHGCVYREGGGREERGVSEFPGRKKFSGPGSVRTARTGIIRGHLPYWEVTCTLSAPVELHDSTCLLAGSCSFSRVPIAVGPVCIQLDVDFTI